MPTAGAANRPPEIEALRRQALEIFREGLLAADPRRAVERALGVRGGRPEILLDPGRDARARRTGPWRRVRAVAFGKAACAMAEAAAAILPAEVFPGPGIAVTNYDNVRDAPRFRVLGAGHPLPDAAGVAGARAVMEAVRGAGADELILVLISGGGSALLPAPAAGISLADKVAATDLLLASGADIGELNTIRKHLSELKGGGLARLAAPAALHALILSDVIGDDLSTIASGPTVPDPTTFADADAILRRRGIRERVPAAVRERIEAGMAGAVPETPKPGDAAFAAAGATLVGSNGLSLAAARAAAAERGFEAEVFSDALCGEARAEARRFVGAARRAGGRRRALLAGGETTVAVRGRGRGGRNQEMALAAALALEASGPAAPWVFLSAGTDGRDGPTDAAGGIVDPGTVERIRAAGLDPLALLDDNDSHRALDAAGDLLRTGPTGTNVADLQILLLEK